MVLGLLVFVWIWWIMICDSHPKRKIGMNMSAAKIPSPLPSESAPPDVMRPSSPKIGRRMIM